MSNTRTNDPLVGDVLDGRYEVLQRLARGGMATVYRAWDRRLERIVAIKVMHEGLGDDSDFAAKFDREARAAARLCDHNVVSIFDQGHDHGRPYIVMEFVQGHTLRALITKNAPLSPLQALTIIEPIAAALATAHESGLVHRDVKPENVMISDDGNIKVADFGLARSAQAATATQGLLIGTVSYLPPELLTTGRAHSGSDIYSTGVVLFEMLTGTKPYSGDTPISVAYKHVNEDMPAPSQVLARKHPEQIRTAPIPDYLDALVVSCTRRNPAMRPKDGRDLLRRVRRARRALEAGITSDEALVALMNPGAFIASTSTAATQLIDTSPVVPEPTESFEHTPSYTREEVEASTWSQSAPATLDKAQSRPAKPEPQPVAATRFPKLTRMERMRRRRTIFFTSLLLILTLGVGTGAWWFTSGRYVTTPSVINQTQEVAAATAEEYGFSITFTEDYSETVPQGLVISSDPEPGKRVIRKSAIVAVISKGPERYSVPALAGLTLDAATQALSQVNLVVGEVSEDWSQDVAEGLVVSASLAEGELVKRDTAVNLVVSKGREPLTVPDVVGKSREEAEKILTEAGFAVEITQERNDATVEKDHVITQDPLVDTQAYRGDTVKLVISSGPELVKVPDVVDKPRAEGIRELQDAGFDVTVESSSLFASKITKTDPKADTEVAKGSKITVTLG